MPARNGSTDVTNASLVLDSGFGAVFNEGGQAALDFRVESDSNANMIFVDAGNNKVGIGTNSPSETLHVAGNMLVNNNASIKANGSGALVLGNTNSGVIEIKGDGGSSIIQGQGNSLVLQTVRDTDDIIFNVNKGGTDSDGTEVTVMKIDGELGHVDIPTDDTRLRLGAGQDLQIFHDGSNSYIDSDTGLLRLDGNDGVWIDDGGSNILRISNSSVISFRGLDITGDSTFNGSISATSKSFVIPHPTKERKTLRHGSLEGPEHGVYVRGTLETADSTEGFIELPDYWLGLVDEDTITVQLTGKTRFQRLYVAKIEDNKVYVENEKMHRINCYYFIQAERKDIAKMVVEY